MFNLDLGSFIDKFKGASQNVSSVLSEVSGLGQTANTVWSNWTPMFEDNNVAVQTTNKPVGYNIVPAVPNIAATAQATVPTLLDNKFVVYGGLGLGIGIIALVALKR